MGKVFIGTSGWQYGHWRGSFYPENLSTAKWLSYYASFFNTVEANSSFYHEIKGSTFEKWQAQVPKDFIFAVKGHWFITHIKRLNKINDPVRRFVQHISMLTREYDKRHVILWQLPPKFKKDTDRLKKFFKLLPKQFRHAFEFRHESWIDNEVWQIFKKSKVECTAVIQDWRKWPRLTKPVGKFVYLRFHGREALYSSNYSKNELKGWAKKIKVWRKKGLDVYAYFNNDAAGFAVSNARTLKELVT